jgi:hypothetical protein
MLGPRLLTDCLIDLLGHILCGFPDCAVKFVQTACPRGILHRALESAPDLGKVMPHLQSLPLQ